ncbi:MAG: hypothetical protein AB1426_06805 [Bacillota bacterium]
MEAVKQALYRYKKRLLSIPNALGVGLGKKMVRGSETDQTAIVVFVEKKLPPGYLTRATMVPKTIGDVKTDVVETGRFRLLGKFTGRQRPAQPGLSIGHYLITAGTFGAVVYDSKTDKPLILSNNHILANASNGRDRRCRPGDPILQPAPFDGGELGRDTIAILERFIPMRYGAIQATCPVAAGAEYYVNTLLRVYYPQYRMRLYRLQETANKVDCAVAKPVEDDLIKNEILEIGAIKGIAECKPGLEVKKCGRTSGLTSGVIKYTDVTTTVDVGEERQAVFEDQFMTSQMSRGGDSGALVLDENGNAVGLLFAGSDDYTLCNDIRNVLDALNVRLSPKGGAY